MKEKYDKGIGIAIVIFYMLFQSTGCSYFTSSAAMEVFTREEQVETFYGEGMGKVYIDDQLIQEIEYKEWKGKNKKYHSEAEAVTKREFFDQYYNEEISEEMLNGDYVTLWEEDTVDDKQCIVYLPHKNQYSIQTLSLEDEVTNNIRMGVDRILENGSFKDYVMELIDEYEKDYILSIDNDVRVNNYLTQHLTMIPKDQNKDEKIQLWIDQNTWVIVKRVIEQGNYTEEAEYKKIELNPKINENLFKVEIPENADIQYLDKKFEKLNEKITVDEAAKRLGVPVFYLEEENGIKLLEAHYIESMNQQYGRVELTYIAEDGSQFIVQNSPSSELYEKISLGYEKIKIRDIEAIYVEMDTMKCIEFIKDGTICDIYIKNSEMSKEKLIELANKLKLKS